MDNIELEKARKKFEELKKEKEELIKFKEEFEKTNERNKKYIKHLHNSGITIVPEDINLIRQSFYDIDKDKLDKIYLYLGAYKKEEKRDKDDKQLTEEEYLKADYLLYQNLANQYDNYTVDPIDRENFEKEHLVIRKECASKYNSIYFRLQGYYYETLLTEDNNIEELTEKIKKKAKELI